MLLQHFRGKKSNTAMKHKTVTRKKSVLTEKTFGDSNKTDMHWGKQRLNLQ